MAVGEGGKVQNGGVGEGRCREVNSGSKRREAGVQTLFKIFNAFFDPRDEAVVNVGAAIAAIIVYECSEGGV